MKNLLSRIGLGVAMFAVPALAFASTAGTTGTGDPFESFRNTVVGWVNGPLGTGLSITMMLMGAGMGVARNSPMPALSGIAGAAFLNWGPDIITTLTEGALI